MIEDLARKFKIAVKGIGAFHFENSEVQKAPAMVSNASTSNSNGGSFWRTFGFHAVSNIDSILDRDNFTLEELLDEEQIVVEVASQNTRLIDL